MTVAPAVAGILDAFAFRPLVAIGDYHGVAQELDFYAAIVRDSRFASEVGNVVVEFGSASHQASRKSFATNCLNSKSFIRARTAPYGVR